MGIRCGRRSEWRREIQGSCLISPDDALVYSPIPPRHTREYIPIPNTYLFVDELRADGFSFGVILPLLLGLPLGYLPGLLLELREEALQLASLSGESTGKALVNASHLTHAVVVLLVTEDAVRLAVGPGIR